MSLLDTLPSSGIFLTEIEAVDVKTGVLSKWEGPQIKAKSFAEAEKICKDTLPGYCKVIGELGMVIPCDTN